MQVTLVSSRIHAGALIKDMQVLLSLLRMLLSPSSHIRTSGKFVCLTCLLICDVLVPDCHALLFIENSIQVIVTIKLHAFSVEHFAFCGCFFCTNA